MNLQRMPLVGLSLLGLALACTATIDGLSGDDSTPIPDTTDGGATVSGGTTGSPPTDLNDGAPAAGGTTGGETANPDQPGDLDECSGGQICSDACVDPQTDDQHCGGCDQGCIDHLEQCVAGVCQCSPGLDDCFGSCTDLLASGEHCGTCGRACSAGEVCFGGNCVTDCPADLFECSQACVNLDENSQHCGSCGAPCGGNLTCSGGQCGCESGTQCGSSCVDTQTSRQHCGGCDSACPLSGGRSCVAGQCVCGSGQTWCGSSCVNTQTSGNHCGSCGNSCTGNRTCSGGSCVCPQGQTFCSGQCRNTSTDGAHCGSCGNSCSAGQTCSGGTCMGGGGGGACGSGSFNAEVVLSGSTWIVRHSSGSELWSGNNMLEAMRQAVGSLSSGRTSKQKVIVRHSGSIPANQSLDLPSYTIFESCGTINVTGSPSGDNAVVRMRNVTNVDVTHLSVTGGPWFGMFVRRGNNFHFGQIDLRLSGGLGIRIDNDPPNNNWGRSNRVTNVRLDDVYVSGTNNHGVETYGVDGLTIGTVTARNVANAGLLLNATINATVGRVDAEDTAAGTGYAAFRIANEAGRIGNSWPAGNIHVGEVRSRRGGRGIFCVSDSGGTTIDRVDIANAGNNSMLLENCHNTRIAAISGTVSGGGEIRVAQRTNEHTPSSNVTVQNLTVTGTTIRESPCGNNIVVCNITTNSSINVCNGTLRSSCP